LYDTVVVGLAVEVDVVLVVRMLVLVAVMVRVGAGRVVVAVFDLVWVTVFTAEAAVPNAAKTRKKRRLNGFHIMSRRSWLRDYARS
jgi:hypothetical protein